MTAYDMNDTGARALCAAICAQSVKDYFKLKEGRYVPCTNMKELNQFYNSEWGRKLFSLFGLNTQAALRSMEKLFEEGSYKYKMTSLGYSKPKKEDQDEAGL